MFDSLKISRIINGDEAREQTKKDIIRNVVVIKSLLLLETQEYGFAQSDLGNQCSRGGRNHDGGKGGNADIDQQYLDGKQDTRYWRVESGCNTGCNTTTYQKGTVFIA